MMLLLEFQNLPIVRDDSIQGCPVRTHLAVAVGQAFGAAACVAPHDRPDPPEAHDRSEDGHAVHLENADTNAG